MHRHNRHRGIDLRPWIAAALLLAAPLPAGAAASQPPDRSWGLNLPERTVSLISLTKVRQPSP